MTEKTLVELMTNRKFPIHLEFYNQLEPTWQGYISYFQGDWNKQIPLRNPYEKGSDEFNLWSLGVSQAIKDDEKKIKVGNYEIKSS